MEEKKTALTPEETARELSSLAEKLEEMDKAEGEFGENMADDALSDEYLDEVVGGLKRVALTTPGRMQYWRVCPHCRALFGTNNENQCYCNNCAYLDDERGPY